MTENERSMIEAAIRGIASKRYAEAECGLKALLQFSDSEQPTVMPRSFGDLGTSLKDVLYAGPVLKQLRKTWKLSQADVAKICNLDRGSIAHIENGTGTMGDRPIERLQDWLIATVPTQPVSAAELRNLRDRLGYSEKQMAEALNVPPLLVRRVEQGRCPAPPHLSRYARAIAAQNEIDLDQLKAA